MEKYIICTTINHPTKAVSKFDEMEGWKLVVVGDLKTPKDYKLKNGVYLNPEHQEKINPELSELIGWNCIQRRNFGFIYALNSGADIICSVDDDNIPLNGWGQNLLVQEKGMYKKYQTNDVAFDPIGATEYKNLWHRGFPLELIKNRNYELFQFENSTPDVQADFWNGDPDIDAICRLEHGPNCEFKEDTFPFMANKISPFNSQNTFLNRASALDYFLFPHIGRMDDIWASYYVQSLGHKVIYNKASVFQDRNIHNLIDDMKKEYMGYENNLSLINDLYKDPESIVNYLPPRSLAAWNVYRKLIK